MRKHLVDVHIDRPRGWESEEWDIGHLRGLRGELSEQQRAEIMLKIAGSHCLIWEEKADAQVS